MSKRNAAAFEVTEFQDLKKPGAYRFWKSERENAKAAEGIEYGCPCGCGAIGAIEFGDGLPPPEGRGWLVKGEWPNVSVTPSIGFMPNDAGGHHWHGYLTAGVFEEC